MPPNPPTSPKPPPKVLLFDIGGVFVRSPLASIRSFEHSHSLPPGWINHAISRSAPHGSWQRLERGEITLDARFFAAFKADLENPTLWRHFLEERARSKGGTDAAGAWSRDYVERLVRRGVSVDAEALFWGMMAYARGVDEVMGRAVRRLRREHGDSFLVAALSNTVIFPAGHPFSMPGEGRGTSQVRERGRREQELRGTTAPKSGPVGSNHRASDPTPQGPDGTPEADIKDLFDMYISSAHVGMRKPEPEIYELALRWCRDAWRAKVERLKREGRGEGLSEECGPRDFVFLDDIGANLRPAAALGMKTIRVRLGEGGTVEAVRELEGCTGVSLLEEGRARL